VRTQSPQLGNIKSTHLHILFLYNPLLYYQTIWSNVSLTYKNSYVLYGRSNLKERHNGSRNKTKTILLSLSKIQYGCQHLKKYQRSSNSGGHFIILRDVRTLIQGIVAHKVLYSEGLQIFWTYRSHLDILGARKAI